MTEQEARQKWCPFVRLTFTDNGSMYNNRTADEDAPASRCIASDCMAWRETAREATKDDVAICDLYRVGDLIPTGGYCGLAGK